MVVKFNLQSLEFGSCFSYTPRPSSLVPTILDSMKDSKNYTLWLKQDIMVTVGEDKDSIPMSTYVANTLSRNLSTLPFADFFGDYTILVPVPSSSITPPGGLWVPKRIAEAMVSLGIGDDVVTLLKRSSSVPKSSYSSPAKRPSPSTHYDSLTVERSITDITNVILIDDVITRGSTMIGCANRLLDEIPGIKVRGFGAIRTMSYATNFVNWYDPVKGSVILDLSGDPQRTP